LHDRLKEVIELCLEELSEEDINILPDFIGLRQISRKIQITPAEFAKLLKEIQG